MDPGQNNFIANKIGTLDGEYTLNSKYVMIEMNEDATDRCITLWIQRIQL
jgi:hypothetical protein